jgi:taurine dioxygenase
MSQAISTADAPYSRITVQPMCAAAGAVIGGVDLSKPLDGETVSEVRRAFLDHHVIVFRDQDLDPASQIAFTEHFGKVEGHPLYRTPDIAEFPDVIVLEHKAGKFYKGKNELWHSDVTVSETPPLGSVLHCRACWEGYADTMFANQYLAYEALSDTMRSFLEGLTAEHSGALNQILNNADPINARIESIPDPVVHPVVRTHPETGRWCLYVNPGFTSRIRELSAKESDNLLAFLYDHAVQHRFIYRHRWRPGDVAMFDNRCLMHSVVQDHPHDMHRRMHRTTAAGDRPYL